VLPGGKISGPSKYTFETQNQENGGFQMVINATPQASTTESIPASRIPALEYHDADYKGGETIQMTPEWFLAQMQWLSDNGYKTLTGGELFQYVMGASRPPQKSCFLRFDLGLPVYKSFQEVIVPALIKFSFHATFFVLTSNIKDIQPPKTNFVCWSHLLEWEKTGAVEVGSHSVTHPDFRPTGTPRRLWELRESKRAIETKLGHPISFFAWPYDSVPNHPDVLLKLFGYKLGFAGFRNERSIVFKDANAFALPCYYPYSSKKAYPLITTTNKLTFGQMIESATALPK
jgi:peptidoglycan/xylan/chitin deacetylase (PgdA/CDA1 family)